MRRSLAPSQVLKLKDGPTDRTERSGADAPVLDDDGMTTIQRLPLFGFLEIPKEFNKQFKVPSGCVLTEKYVVAVVACPVGAQL